MWEMLEDINFDCDECGGPGPPPKFMIPPPPRPPFMQELIKCNNDEINISSSSNRISDSNSNSDINWDSDNMCDAIPILDASYHSSPTLQTSAMIAVFSLLLVLVVLISSLFVWKHKRKVQNFFPCKTPTRGPHITSGISGGHSVTYEDPDAHLGHRPLVMRNNQNVEILHHSKAIHYPSGYPMTRSPPLFVCSSPGPDPYRSNDNVYEELGPGRDSDVESEPVQQSDDDFAEDELSLPGERSIHKTSPPDSFQHQNPVSTIYHERTTSLNPQEHNTLLASSRQSDTQNLRNLVCLTGSSNCGSGRGSGAGGILSEVFRHTLGRNKTLNGSNTNSKKTNNRNTKYNNNQISLQNDSDHLQQSNGLLSDIVPTIYNDSSCRNSLMTLAFNSNNNNFQTNSNTSSNNLSNINYPNSNNNNRPLQHCYNTLESDVERRNRINNQLHQPPMPPPPPPVATIFRGSDRINSRYPQPYFTHHHGVLNGKHQKQQHQQQQQQQQLQRSRTNPRSLDRRRMIIPPEQTTQIDEPTYACYAEPVFHEGLIYGHELNPSNTISGNSILRHAYPSYILPDYTSSPYSILGNKNLHHHHNHITNYHQHQQHHYPSVYNNHSQDLLQHSQTQQQQQQQQQQQLISSSATQQQQQLYSRDSSFGSDSGYSHHTQASLTSDGVRMYGRNGGSSCSGGSTGIRTPTTPTLSLPPDISSCGSSAGDVDDIKVSNGTISNFQWNRKQLPLQSHSQSTVLTNSCNNNSNKSNNIKDNNSMLQATKIAISDDVCMNGITVGAGAGAGVGVHVDGGIGNGGLLATMNNCNNSKNTNSNYNNCSNNNNQLNSKNKSNDSSGSINNNNNNSNMNCLSGVVGTNATSSQT